MKSQLRRLGFGLYSTNDAVFALWHASWRASAALSATTLAASIVLGVASPLNYVAMGAVVNSLVGSRSLLWPSVVFLIVLMAVRTALPAFIEPLTSELVRRVDRHF